MLSRFIDKEYGPLILRLTLGLSMLISHGMPKLLDYNAKKDVFPDPLGVSSQLSLILVIFAEVVCSIFIILGLKIRITTIPLIITMAIAAFIIHAGEPWKKQELAALYLSGFITLFFTGEGKFAVKR